MKTQPLINMLRKIPALLILLMGFWGMEASGQNTANITMSPVSSSVTVGSTFTVMVKLDFTSPPGTSSLDAIEVHLTFDRTKLQVTNIVEQPVVAAFTSKPTPLEPAPYTTMNTGTGQINYAVATTGTLPNTDFDVLAITFQAIAGGGTTTPLTFRRNPPFNNTDAYLAGISVLANPFVVNASANIITAGCTLSAATISNQSTCNGTAFDLTLASVTGGNGPFDLVINGTTYNDIAAGATITNITAPTQTIFTTPVNTAQNLDNDGVTLGTRFKSTASGYVKGVRFYSTNNVSGTYTGLLFTTSGTILASAPFTSVTSNAWQQVLFTTPVLIQPNTEYIIAYFTSDGRYVSTETGSVGSFDNATTNGVLTALADGAPNPNGLFFYDAAPGLPTGSYNSSNYWIDLVFQQNSLTYNLTSVTDNGGCNISGAPLQTLNVTSASCTPLPVTLINLSATPQGKNNILVSWSTASEFENKGFEVQRSIDNSLWEGLTFVKGAGNSGFTLNYSYSDNNLFPRKYYYRLKQIDIDGKFTYSAVVAASIEGKAAYELSQNFPNPFKGETTIRYTLPESSKVLLTVYDLHGRAMQVLVNGTKSAGMHAQQFYTSSLPAGVYYYKLQAGKFSAVKKLVIQ